MTRPAPEASPTPSLREAAHTTWLKSDTYQVSFSSDLYFSHLKWPVPGLPRLSPYLGFSNLLCVCFAYFCVCISSSFVYSHLNILTSEYQLSTGSLDQLVKMFSPSSVSGLWQNFPSASSFSAQRCATSFIWTRGQHYDSLSLSSDSSWRKTHSFVENKTLDSVLWTVPIVTLETILLKLCKLWNLTIEEISHFNNSNIYPISILTRTRSGGCHRCGILWLGWWSIPFLLFEVRGPPTLGWPGGRPLSLNPPPEVIREWCILFVIDFLLHKGLRCRFPLLIHTINSCIIDGPRLTSGWVMVMVFTVVFFPSWYIVFTEVEVEVDISGLSQLENWVRVFTFDKTLVIWILWNAMCHPAHCSIVVVMSCSHVNPVFNAFTSG